MLGVGRTASRTACTTTSIARSSISRITHLLPLSDRAVDGLQIPERGVHVVDVLARLREVAVAPGSVIERIRRAAVGSLPGGGAVGALGGHQARSRIETMKDGYGNPPEYGFGAMLGKRCDPVGFSFLTT